MSIHYPLLHLQWHVTARCLHRCQHCYMYDDETYQSEIANELALEDCIKIIDDFVSTLKCVPARGHIDFTGGDPLLREDLFDLLAYARDHGLQCGIMGNPDLIDEAAAQKLGAHGVAHFQLSLDGMEQTHDGLRSQGSFRKVLQAARLLQDAGIGVNIMNTLGRHNAGDLLPLMGIVGEEGIGSFSFARISAVGSGRQYRDSLLEPREFRELYLQYFKESATLRKKGVRTRYARKDHLWIPLFLEEGWLKGVPELNDTHTYSGCAIGGFGLIVLADGTAMACRRFPSIVGKMPQQSFAEIFFHSGELNRMRDIRAYEKCSKCELVRFCRGCPATAYGAHGSAFAPDPQCWRSVET